MRNITFVKKLFNKIVWKKRTKEAKQVCKKHNEWKKLTSEEKAKLRTNETYAYVIYKNLYKDWDKSPIEFFVSDAYYQTVLLPKLNKLNYDTLGIKYTDSYFTDKNYEDFFASGVRFPKTIIKNINGEFYNADFENISESEARKILSGYEKAVFKKSIFAGHGKGVQLVEKSGFDTAVKNFDSNYIVQEVVKQNELTARFNESSVNIFRITSLFWKGEIYILGIILRVGAPGAFCDHLGADGVNPRVVEVSEDGKLGSYCLDPDDGVIYPDMFGQKLGTEMPFVPEMIEIVKREHKKYPHHRIIGWDFTADENGEIYCIEYNGDVPGIVQTQMISGPVFARKTERGVSLLDEIIGEK